MRRKANGAGEDRDAGKKYPVDRSGRQTPITYAPYYSTYSDTVTPDVIAERIDRQVDQTVALAFTGCSIFANTLQVYAKTNHNWQNRTHDTNDTTVVEFDPPDKDIIAGTLKTGTYYSRFLELAHSGQWAWLWPAAMSTRDDLLEALKITGQIEKRQK